MVSGNSGGNLMNGGLAVQGENWIYFANGDDKNKLYKMSSDGHELMKICDDAISCLNLMGDFLYYHHNQDEGLYRIDIHGQGRLRLLDCPCWHIWVSNEKIYYTNLHTDNKLCQINVDGCDQRVLIEKNINGFTIVNQNIFYLESSQSYGLEAINSQGMGSKLYRTDLSGNHDELILSGVETFNIVGPWIYFINALDNYSLYKMQVGSRKKHKISSDITATINVAGEWVYYMNVTDESKLYKIRTDGTERTKLSQSIPNNINVVAPWVFYEDVLNDYKISNIKG